jgi:FkbM family methyltransferase
MGEQTVRFRPYDDCSFTITGSEHDVGVVGEIERSGGHYQHELALWLRTRLKPKSVVVDGGAHIGVLTVLMARLCPGGRVFAFEPSPDTRTYLEGNLAANDATNVTVERAALYDRDGEVALDVSAAQPSGAHVAGGGGTAAPAATATVHATRLDTWAVTQGLDRLDLVKLDVEGTEIAVLAGAEATIRRFRPVVVVECNPVALRRFGGRSYTDLVAALRGLFPVVGIVGGGGRLFPLRSADHLELVLGDRGGAELGGPRRRPGPLAAVADRRRAAADLRRLRAIHDGDHPPAMNLVIDPAVKIVSAVSEVVGQAGATAAIPVTVVNGTRWWLSSSFPYVPVHLAYRIFDEAGNAVVPEGRRTVFPEPVRPGATVDVALDVNLPHPGRFELVLTPVQEHFTWLDELDPAGATRLPLVVTE